MSATTELQLALGNLFGKVANEIVTTLNLASAALQSGVAARADLAQESGVVHSVPLTDFRVWDALHTMVLGTAANDDLALITGTFGTDEPKIRTSDAKNTTVTQRTAFFFSVPEHYVAGQAITLRLPAGMKTTIANGTATIDAEVYRTDAPTADICATAAQSINSLTAANKDFTITPTDVVVGDMLLVRITIAITDSATGTAVLGEFGKPQILMATKG